MSLPERHPYGTARCQFGELFAAGRRRAVARRRRAARRLLEGAVRAQADAPALRRPRRDAGGRRGTSSTAASAGSPAAATRARSTDVAAAVDHLADLPAHRRPGCWTWRASWRSGTPPAAHLAAWLATRERARVSRDAASSRRPASSTCGSRRSWRSRDGVVHRFLGGTPAAVPERYAPPRRPSGCRSACRCC